MFHQVWLDHDDAHTMFAIRARCRTALFDSINYPLLCEEVCNDNTWNNFGNRLFYCLFAVRDLPITCGDVHTNDPETAAGNIHSWDMVAVRVVDYFSLTRLDSLARLLEQIEHNYPVFANGDYSIIASAFYRY